MDEIYNFKIIKFTGSYHIGTTDFYFNDSSRKESRSKNKNDERKWVVRAWYPTEVTNNSSKAFYANGLAEIFKRIVANGLNVSIEELTYLDQLNEIETNSAKNAPIISGKKFPVLFFSHGLGQSSFLYTSLLEDLASHGFVILAIEHTYFYISGLLPDGCVIEEDELHFAKKKTFKEIQKANNEEMENWISDILFTLNQFKSADIDNKLKESIDFDQMGILGHSMGGAVSVQLCRRDNRFKAGVNIDGGLYGIDTISGFAKPFMFILGRVGDEPTENLLQDLDMSREAYHSFMQMNHELFKNLMHDSYYILLPKADHMMFSEFPLVLAKYYPKSKYNMNPSKALEFIRLLLVTFFNQYFLNTEPTVADVLQRQTSLELKYEVKIKSINKK